MFFRKGNIGNLLGHYKYLIVIVLGTIMVGVVGNNSFHKRIQYELQIGDLKDEIERYNAQNEHDTKKLQELTRNPKAIEKVARERYFMKTDDEDIFVLSDDQTTNDNDENNE